ncbi:ETX/MTX2 family pore-forming toxin [Bacteroides thetaiotaomicron]|uniref:ETX/MTX2 family pore-forming toxin n=1 Tax=Bacteroides thetaiotaomicron TaxID=818 RepID=UPI00232E31D4|nr:ETX/MTX2 family pore-forming toxin [Bacteroides thetaiotaomicron]MDC2008443.1 ETX/MTX2 family pore-forming toxin [Bacteroides thetaiotaomicron]MDC2020390.1 ETX/MTX2 family pore-forming toxin [Bacteroides thetaiotaomicron]MDC2026580.1 ETX/MTX2 family pore-forming toxin [Bacteroides thetaiotaomicron]MDC2029350.1 ETX/MTX2 family pore-forming toxin [Bacteroides thetaiotaomicron]MDC2060747.1 ETX/MTX2 family pore-forming toxin [Bacteroides thetaiotaomicron]
MKKIMFLFCIMLVLFSCEQENTLSEISTDNNENGLPLTRSSSDLARPIEQLDGIPVNIKSVYSKKYLSVVSDNGKLGLVDEDDGSLRQRWIVKVSYAPFVPFKVSSLYRFNNINSPMIASGYFEGSYGLFVGETIFDQGTVNFSAFDQYSYYFTTLPEGGMPPFGTPIDPQTIKMYVQPASLTSNDIIIDDKYYKGDEIKWEIIPVDEFLIENISYELTTDDKLSIEPKQIAVRELINDTDMPATRVLAFQETVSNESSFSELVGLKITDKISVDLKVDIPEFKDGSFTGETTTEASWSYTVGKKETKTQVLSETVTQELPPHTTVKAEMIASKYDATMTYVAKLHGKNSGKDIYLKGKWNGVMVQESRIRLSQDGKIIRTIKLKE